MTDPWDERYMIEYEPIHDWLISMGNVGKYTVYDTWILWVMRVLDVFHTADGTHPLSS